MLNQFRTRYPKGSLTSELLAIKHGKYIVKVLVQVEGTILATGLAASENIEEAEDIARIRALSTVIFDATPINPSPEPSTPQQNLREIIQEPELSLPPQPSLNGNKKQKTIADNLESPTSSSGVSEIPFKSSNVSESLDDDLSSPIAKTSKTPKTAKNKSETVLEETPTQPTSAENLSFVEPTSEEKTPEIPSIISESVPELGSSLVPPSVSDVSNPPVTPVEVETTSTSEPLDFTDIMARSNAQLKRLGWTTEKGRDYLLKTYGKKSRHLLNDEELLQFLNYLESLPTS